MPRTCAAVPRVSPSVEMYPCARLSCVRLISFHALPRPYIHRALQSARGPGLRGLDGISQFHTHSPPPCRHVEPCWGPRRQPVWDSL
eukprot:4142144-Pyramimonas_sp.AAC.2